MIAPSKQAGYNVTTWLAGEGVQWANLHVETPLSLAESYALPAFIEKGFRRLSSDAAVVLMHEILTRVLADGGTAGGLRGALSVGPGLVRSMHRTVADLRLAGVPPTRMASAGIDAEKAQLVGEVYSEYCDSLERSCRYDPADVFRVAMARLGNEPTPYEAIALLDETELTLLAFRFLDAVRERTAEGVRIGRPDFHVDVPDHSVAGRFHGVRLAQSAGLRVHPAGQIRARPLKRSDEDRLRLRDAVGTEAEVHGVFREIRREKVPLDTVEIVYSVADPYLGLIADTASALELPIAFSEGVPARQSRPGQAVVGFYRWIANGLDAKVLAHVLRSRLIRFPGKRRGKPTPRATDIAEVLEVRKAMRGRDELIGAFARHQLQLEADEAAGFGRDNARKLEQLRVGRRALELLIGLVPETQETSVSNLARAGIRFLNRYFKPTGAAGSQALQSILDRLEGFTELQAAGSTESMAALLESLLSSHRFGASVARDGHLYAVPIERAGYSGRKNVFVVGLDEGSFPGGGIESPILLDADRERISHDLEAARSGPADQTWRLLRLLGALPGTVTLVANRFQIIDGRERYAASVYAQCREDLQMEVPERYAASFELSDAVSESDAWLAQRRAKDFFAAVAGRYPLLSAGRYATLMRQNSDITRFDGYLGTPTPELSLRRGKVVSASRLERLAECPHRYFLQYVLNVQPPDPIDPEDNRWLDARDFGKLVHQLLFEFMTRLEERSERPEYGRHVAELLDLAEQMAAEARTRIPPETELAFRAGLRRLKNVAEIFLAAESRTPRDVDPIHFELKFGDENPASRHPRPVEIDLGGDIRLALRGSIDRVDRTAEGFNIWDYKTGSSVSFDRLDPYHGEKLQWALYAFAFEKMMAGLPTHLSVRRSGYFFVGDQENGRRISYAVPERDVFGKYLSPLLELVEQGGFVHFQKRDWKSSACRFCDFKTICANERREASSLPKDDAAITGLEAIIEPLTAWMKPL